MNSRVGSQIDSLSGHARETDGCVHHELGAPGEREDSAMVIRIARPIEERLAYGSR
jgi:hexokinase